MTAITEELRRIYRLEEMDWKTIMRQGVIVKLTLRRWRGKTKLTFADLGIDLPEDEARATITNIIQLGNKKLLPPETLRALDNIDRSARFLLERSSYQTAFGRFVPFTAFATWRDGNTAWEQRYYAIRDGIVDDYSGIVWRIMQDYHHLAREAWNILAARSPATIAHQEPEAFIAAFTERVRVLIPTPAQIRDSFAYETHLLQVSFPDLVEGQEREISVEEVVRHQEHQEQEQRALTEREQQLAAMNRAVVAQARQQKEQVINGFLADIATQIRTLAYETITDVLGALTDAPTLLPQQSRKLQFLIEQLTRLNFMDDLAVSTILNTVQALVAQPGKERNMDTIRRQLRALAVVTRADLATLGDVPRAERAEQDAQILGTSSVEEIRAARVEFFGPLLQNEDADMVRQSRMDDERLVLPAATTER